MAEKRGKGVDTYYVPSSGANREAEKVVATRMNAGDHVHTWALNTGTLCMLEKPCGVRPNENLPLVEEA